MKAWPLTVLVTGMCLIAHGFVDPPKSKRSLSQLEEQLVAIDSELEELARYSLRSGVGAVGYRSEPHKEDATTEWIQVELPGETLIDLIVLVPVIRRDTKTGFQANGFPKKFRIIAGKGTDTRGTVVASFDLGDRLLPRIAPVMVPCRGRTIASWVRLEATVLSPRAFDDQFDLQLSEILVFRGQENVALRQSVEASGRKMYERGPRGVNNLVNGFVPYEMDAAGGERSLAFLSRKGIGDKPWFVIDLETIQPVNRIQLHATELSDTVPQSSPTGLAIPGHLVVEGAIHSDFSDAVRLTEFRMETIYDVSPIIIRSFPETLCRYVRLTAVEPYINTERPEKDRQGSQIGFAEIELYSGGRNVALGKTVSASFVVQPRGRSIAAMTDGRNFYGRILPIRQWLMELARRHDLEAERPLVVGELNLRYARQKKTVTLLVWVAAALAAGIVITILIGRIIRMKQAARIGERFAADLHDELGANLHAIGILGELAKGAIDSRDELIETVDEIQAVSQRTRNTARRFFDINVTGLHGSLPDDMRRTAQRMMADIEVDISIEGEDILETLKSRTLSDLALFHKECLVNISRHSRATKISVRLTASPGEILLTVTDDGIGIPASAENKVPPSLKRRARLLGARVSAESSPNGGTCITLKLRMQRFGPGFGKFRKSEKT